MASLYLQRYAYPKQLIKKTTPSNLGMAVIIPCYNELNLLDTLISLSQCHQPNCAVEVIVIINDCEDDSDEIKVRNQHTLSEARIWVKASDSLLNFHVLYESLPSKHAGVGLARKVGMDEAVRRFHEIQKNGLLVCLDADCRVDPNYLCAIENHFQQHAETPGCSIYYEHPLEGPLSSAVYEGIVVYELHLRYYTHALRYAGHPFAFQTVGSAMAVRSHAYEKQGGMNKRQAGEDFYFLQRIFLLGHFSELKSTRVVPSPRASNRVPFGTGKAISSWLQARNSDDVFETYNPLIFKDLRHFLSFLPEMPLASPSKIWDRLPPSMKGFLGQDLFSKKLLELRNYSSTSQSFNKRFFNWCNGFFAFKFAHFAREHFHPSVHISQAASWLLNESYQIKPHDTAIGLLEQFRKLDRDAS